MAKTDVAGPLLLDTHVWVWYVEGDRAKFSSRIEPVVEAAVERAELLVSAISVWEVAQLEALRRLQLSQDVRTWVARALAFPGVMLKGVTPPIAIESTRLPGEPHRDPADRLLIATARLTGAALVTCDTRLLAYARAGHLRVVDARR
ncbi:MAG: type II toxin-antitoxin system VapC family toxin [Vicinamibacterales bacterium]